MSDDWILLIPEDPRFGVAVGSQGAMPVEMVGGNVEHGGDVRPESPDGFKLEAGYLKHSYRILGRFLDQRNGRSANIAAHEGGKTAVSNHFTGQGRGCGLAVRTGNGNDPAGKKLGRQFDFSDDLVGERAPAPEG